MCNFCLIEWFCIVTSFKLYTNNQKSRDDPLVLVNYSIGKKVGTIENVLYELGRFLNSLLSMEVIGILGTIGGIVWKLFKKINKKIDEQHQEILDDSEKKHQEMFDELSLRLNGMEIQLLRLQILDGIDAERLGISEVLTMLDRYKSIGGNSYVEAKVMEYVKRKEQEEHYGK